MPAPKRVPITVEQEALLWENKHLSLDSSAGLIQAVIFYLIKCFGVWHGKYLKLFTTEHVKYGEDERGKFITIDTGSVLKTGKVIRRYDDPRNPRSLYKIVKIYQGYLANEGPLLVRPISSIKDYVCYSPWPLGVAIIDQTAHHLMKDLGDNQMYANASICLMAVDILKNVGLGDHCMNVWCQHLSPPYRTHMKTGFNLCGQVNCEEKNLNLSLLISRLLDPPYPSDIAAVSLDKKKLADDLGRRKLQMDKNSFDFWFGGLNICCSDCEDVIYQKTEELTELGGTFDHHGTELFGYPSSNKAGLDAVMLNNQLAEEESPSKKVRVKLTTSQGHTCDRLAKSSVGPMTEQHEGDLKAVKNEVDDGDDLPVTFIKKEMDEDESDPIEHLTNLSPVPDLQIKLENDCENGLLSPGDGHECTSRPPAVPTPTVDSIRLLRDLLKQETVVMGHTAVQQETAQLTVSCDTDIEEVRSAPEVTKLGSPPDQSPPGTDLKQTQNSRKTPDPHFHLSKFPASQSTKLSPFKENPFPLLRTALESAPVDVTNSSTTLPGSSSSFRKTKRKRNSLHFFKTLKHYHKKRRTCGTMGSHSASVRSTMQSDIAQAQPSETVLLNSPLADLRPHSGIYHLTSDHRKQSAYQTVKIRTDSGTKLFTIGDVHQETPGTLSSAVLSSETNIGDYFPEGTMIPASGLKLLTRSGSQGLEVLLKFDYINGGNHKKNFCC